MSTSIIRADTSHLSLLVPLMHAYREFYEQTGDEPAEKMFLKTRLEHEEAIVFLAIDTQVSENGLGFVQLFPSFDSVELGSVMILHDLFVVPDGRRKGVARLLMDTARDFSRASGAIRIDLSTAFTNTIAQALYDSLGYERDAEFHHYYLSLQANG